MTKNVRVENGCTSAYKVVVEVWDKGRPASADAPGVPDVLVQTIPLGHPTALADVLIHAGRYLIVKEA